MRRRTLASRAATGNAIDAPSYLMHAADQIRATFTNLHVTASGPRPSNLQEMRAQGVLVTMPPKKQDSVGVLAQFVDSERRI